MPTLKAGNSKSSSLLRSGVKIIWKSLSGRLKVDIFLMLLAKLNGK